MNTQTIHLTEHGHDFFLRYPDAVAALQVKVAERDVAATFHYVHELLRKEQGEHLAAAQNEHATHARLTALTKSLRQTAYGLERGLNATLDLLGRSAEAVDFVPTSDFSSSVEQFAGQLTRVQDILDTNPVYQTHSARFLAELAEYQTAAGSIGGAKTVADTEKQEFFEAVDAYEPIIAALHALIQRYLAKVNPSLLAEYRAGLAARRKKAAEMPSETPPASGAAV